MFAAILLLNGCKDPFTPTIKEVSNNILVVEGLINSGADSTIIKLSRTKLVSDKKTLNPEIGATVTVESESNEVIPLVEKFKGSYVFLGLNLNKAKKYRLRIKTAKNETYLSDFVEVKVSPAIDQVSWKAANDRVNISVNTHDDTNNSKYYRWEYAETWIFYSAFESLYKWDGSAVVKRILPEEGIFKCWGDTTSSTVILGSTAKLANDVVFESPITYVPFGEKLRERYSINVKQYVLTKEAYEFWEQLRKNTESLGSIFDAQPSELTGNIHNIANQSEPVLGFISVGTTTQKRIYIDRPEISSGFLIPQPAECLTPSEVKAIDFKQTYQAGFNIPVSDSTAGSRYCVDCTIRGKSKKPAFWQ